MYCYAYNNVFKNDILGLDTIERDISEVWKHYVASNPNRNQRLDNQRKQILAHGCIGYACLYTGKSPDMIFLSNQKCFLSLERAIKEKKHGLNRRNAVLRYLTMGHLLSLKSFPCIHILEKAN